MSEFKFKREPIRTKEVDKLCTHAIRQRNRAKRSLTLYKRTGLAEDYRRYEKERKRAYRYTKRVERLTGQKVGIYKGLPTLSKLKEVHKNIRQERVKRLGKKPKMLKTKFRRTVKYKTPKGETKKKRVTFKFRDKSDIADLMDRIREGKVPIPEFGEEVIMGWTPTHDFELIRLTEGS